MPKEANRKNLTQLAAERLRPPTGGEAVTYWDKNLPGFGLRVSPKGRKTFIAQYRVKGGKEVLETIGTIELIPSVADARNRARASIDKARQGIHPIEDREQKKAQDEAEAAASAFTFAKLAERYMNEYAYVNTRSSTAAETERLLNKAAKHFGDKPIRDIKKADVIELLTREPGQTGIAGLSELNHVLSAVRRAFKWALAHDICSADPTFGVLKPLANEPTRDRVLTDDEIVKFWDACGKIGWPFGPLYKLLLLTGQRLNEVAGMRWSELDLDNKVWHLPPERTKNGKAHDIHLSDFALEIIDSLVRFKPAPGKPDFVFSFNGHAAVTGFWPAKANVEKHMGVDNWRLHDLRRTATTGMARLGIPPHVADRVLNHTGGKISGVARVYNRFEYIDERKAALDAWARFVASLVRPETAPQNVVDFKRQISG